MEKRSVTGEFIDDQGETWYRINRYDDMHPFFIALASDSDLWAYVSTTGSLAAGRRDAEGSFFPYETVDKIHRRWEHTGPRTWIRIITGDSVELWEPFAPAYNRPIGQRSVWKNLSSTRLRFREVHPSGRLTFQHEWSTAGNFGLIRSARLSASEGNVSVQVLDGLLNLIPPGVGVAHSSMMSSLSDAYKWNESLAGGRLGLFTLYAQIWDRAEPKESFEALTVWHAGLPAATKTLLSDEQIANFCHCGQVTAEPVTRGKAGAFLVNFDADLSVTGIDWHIVVDGPKSQVDVFELSQCLATDPTMPEKIRAGLAENTAGIDELLERADGIQVSGDPMAAAHHRANVLFNIMRGGVFVNGTTLDRDDIVAFVRQRNKAVGDSLATSASAWPAQMERAQALELASKIGLQAERLVGEYLPLTFSRRHGDPSRPWNKFSIRVRDETGRRAINYQGNWRDIFQNWEALSCTYPEYLGAMISAFLGAMTADGYNPYRISRDGIDWEIVEHDNPWSNIGYWGDHQVIYLLRLLEALHARNSSWFPTYWDRPVFSFADVPYRLKSHAQQALNPKSTITFDESAHKLATQRAARIGADGLLICDESVQPVMGGLAEKLVVILLAKAGSLVPGGGLWLHTQRPEWNDANNALVGNGLSVVTLAYFRRFLNFIAGLPVVSQSYTLPATTLEALTQLGALLRTTPSTASTDAVTRRAFFDQVGAIAEKWRASAYLGNAGRSMVAAPAGLLPTVIGDLLPLIDASLACCRREDDLFHSYNLLELADTSARVSHLYPMLEGQVAILSSGFLSLSESVGLLDSLFESALFDVPRQSFVLYPDRPLPDFLTRNRLDAEALQLPIVKRLLSEKRTDLLQQQSDGTVRFSPGLANRADLEAAASDLGAAAEPLANAYERILKHHEFTGRSGTMFGYEGLGCIYWHMVAKLLLAVQELVFEAEARHAPELARLISYYRKIRDGLGYKKDAAAYGAFPSDPYSHTPAGGGAQQPGMTGQVKEEVLTRWGELGLQMQSGRIRIVPVLLDESEIPPGGELAFTWAMVPYRYKRGDTTQVKTLTSEGWRNCPDGSFDPRGVTQVVVEVNFDRLNCS